MKKILTILLSLAMIVGLCACGSEKPTENNEKDNTNTNVENVVEETEDNETEVIKEDEVPWGVTENIVVDNNNILLRVFVNFSNFTGPTRGTGKLATQSDGSIMLFDGQNTENDLSPEKLEDVFPTYFEKAKFVLESEYVVKRKNFDFTIEKEEIVTINDYQMYKVSGKHSYTVVDENYKEKDYTCDYVAYATKTKGNDAIAYWMVIDGTQDNSLANKIDELGQKMANSFFEQQ